MNNPFRHFIYKALRKSESVTKTDMVYLARGGGVLGVGQVVASLASFVLAVSFANLLPQDTYGIYKFVLSLTGIVGAFSLTGLGSAVTRASARGDETILKKGFRAYLKWGSITALLSVGIGAYYVINENLVLATAMLIVALFYPLSVSSSLYLPFLTGQKKFQKKTVLGMIQNVIPVILLIGTAFITDEVLIILFVYFASTSLVTFALYRHVLRHTKEISSPNSHETITYGKHLSFMNILGVLTTHIDKVLLFHYLGAVQLAIYSFALAPVAQLQTINKILQSLVLPKISSAHLTDIKKNVPQKALILFVFALALVALYIPLAPFIFKFFFPAYTEAILFSQVFSLTILSFPTMLFTQTLVGHMKYKELYVMRTLTPIAHIVLMLILIPLYGVWGAVFSILVRKIFNFLLVLILFIKTPVTEQQR